MRESPVVDLVKLYENAAASTAWRHSRLFYDGCLAAHDAITKDLTSGVRENMGLFEGKKGLILGVANDRSIAWAIAQEVMNQGGICGFTHLPDRPDDEKQKNKRRVLKCTEGWENAQFLVPLNVQDDDQIRSVMSAAKEELGSIDFLLHSIAFADRDDLNRDTIETSREGFKMAMEISAYSLIAVANAARDLLSENASIVTMSYFGGEKCVPGYNVMGICKAALEASVRYLAYDLGPAKVRVNAVSAGPIKTLAGTAAGVGPMLKLYEHMAPLGNVTHGDVGKTGAFLLSEASKGITGEILHVDGGYHMMGSPGRLLDKLPEGSL
jgi:enoyl-[acyl-carrier protein] reductase I